MSTAEQFIMREYLLNLPDTELEALFRSLIDDYPGVLKYAQNELLVRRPPETI